MHVPFFSERLALVSNRFWDGCNKRFDPSGLAEPDADYKAQQEDKTTRKFISYLRKEPKLKAILAGHLHFFYKEAFSKTATQFVVGGGYLFSGEEILFL